MNKKIILLFALSLINFSLLFGEEKTEKIVRKSDFLFRAVDDVLVKLDNSAVTVKLKEGKVLSKNVKVIRSNKLGYIDVEVPDDIDIEDYVNHLRSTGDFELVKYNEIAEIAVSPNDNKLAHQWYLDAIDMYYAWEMATGNSNVKVAVIDNGFDWLHEDIGYGYDSYRNIDPTLGYNYYLNSTSMTKKDHGTQVAGIISAKTNNGIGIAGIGGGYGCSGVTILPFCITDGSEDKINFGAVDDAICLAVDNGAKVINMSFGSKDTILSNNIDIVAAIDYAYSQGVTLVSATCNDTASYIRFPACYSKVIAVGAMDQSYRKAIFSNYGTGIDLVAPGESIYSTTADNGYYNNIGTSFAAPQVTGIVALMLSVNPNLTPDEIRNIINRTTIQINPVNYTYYMGWNEFVGYGLINAFGAVMSVKDFSISGPSTICSGSQNIFMINDLPFNSLPSYFNITWSTDNNNFHPTGSGKQCSVSYNGTPQYDVANLTATISWKGIITNIITKRIVMHGTDLVVYGEQESYYSSNGLFPYRSFTIPANNGSRNIHERINREVFADKESLPINFIEDNTRDFIFDFCGYGITDINGGNRVYLYSTRFDGMEINFSGLYRPTYFYQSGGYVSFDMPYNSPNYPVTLQAHSDSQCHDFCLTFNVIPLPGVLSGDDIIWVNIDGSMLYVTFMYGGEPIGNGQYYFPSYSVTIFKIPSGTLVYSNTFSGTQTSFSVNTSTWTSGIYTIGIVCNGNLYSKSICL